MLDACINNQSLPFDRSKGWSSFPETPDVGLGLLATFMWAAEVAFETGRAQLIDQYGLSTLTHCGWIEVPSLGGYTRRRYYRYLEVLDAWSQVTQAPPEMVESWLVNRWSARKMAARTGNWHHPTLF